MRGRGVGASGVGHPHALPEWQEEELSTHQPDSRINRTPRPQTPSGPEPESGDQLPLSGPLAGVAGCRGAPNTGEARDT